jgi:RNase P/RNase MRP subunit p30
MAEDILLKRGEGSLYLKRISSKSEINLSDSCDGYLVRASESECRKIISSLNAVNFSGKIAIYAEDEQLNRRLIETLNFDYLVSPEINPGKDSLKQRSAGLNHVLAREAKKKNISILISVEDLLKRDKKEQAILVSRIIQNIKVCRKVGCRIQIASLSSERNLSKKERSFLGTSWGMSSQQVSLACVF